MMRLGARKMVFPRGSNYPWRGNPQKDPMPSDIRRLAGPSERRTVRVVERAESH
jgi:hypothetical protein